MGNSSCCIFLSIRYRRFLECHHLAIMPHQIHFQFNHTTTAQLGNMARSVERFKCCCMEAEPLITLPFSFSMKDNIEMGWWQVIESGEKN